MIQKQKNIYIHIYTRTSRSTRIILRETKEMKRFLKNDNFIIFPRYTNLETPILRELCTSSLQIDLLNGIAVGESIRSERRNEQRGVLPSRGQHPLFLYIWRLVRAITIDNRPIGTTPRVSSLHWRYHRVPQIRRQHDK